MHSTCSAFLLGVFAGLRSLTAPAAVSCAARRGSLHLENKPLEFLGLPATAYILAALAVGELIADKLPQTPSRKAPAGLGARMVTGALCGAAAGYAGDAPVEGAVAGIAGAVAGTFGGYELRRRLAGAFGQDLPAAVVEDLIAVGGAVWIAETVA